MYYKDEYFRVYRNGKVFIEEAKLSSLKSFNREVDSIRIGNECGLSFLHNHDIQKGDIIECYQKE